MSRNWTRRDALALGFGFAAMAGFGPLFAFADGDGGGGGGGEGGEGAGNITNDYGFDYIWHDIGGFHGDDPSVRIEPDQGWDDASAENFWTRIVNRMATAHGKPAPYAGIMSALNATNHDHYMKAAREALQNARTRSGQTRARVVGVGWFWSSVNGVNWQFAAIRSDQSLVFSRLIPRPGSASELLGGDAGWDELVDVSTHNDAQQNENWRNYIYRMGLRDCTGTKYNVVVIAVADGEPTTPGYAQVQKHSSDSLFDTLEGYSPAGAVYTVYKGEQKVGDLTVKADGTSNVLKLMPGRYSARETKAPDAGCFELSDATYVVTVERGKTTTIMAFDKPVCFDAFDIIKVDGDYADLGSVKPSFVAAEIVGDAQGNGLLDGAQFEVKYYAGKKSASQLGEAVRTWRLKVVDGECKFADKYKVSGDAFFISDNKAVLPLGTYTVEEVVAPKGYALAAGRKLVHITTEGVACVG